MTAPTFDGTFPHRWTAEVLPGRPLILPRRQFVYPAIAEEVERGALEVLVQPEGGERFLATCALGFRDPATPTGIWSLPDPDWLCTVSGGYAYLIDVTAPERFVFLRYRPVLEVRTFLLDDAQSEHEDAQSAHDTAQSILDKVQSVSGGLTLFSGHHTILAWGRDGEVWESDRLSWEGVTIDRIEGNILHGKGWDLMTDKDLPFAVDLMTGRKI